MNNPLATKLLALFFLLPLGAFAQSDDFGMDFSVEAEKKLFKGVDFSIEANARTQDNTRSLERLGIGGMFSIKVLNTKQLDLSIQTGYDFTSQLTLPATKDHFGENTYNTPEGPVTDIYYDGYNSTEEYWRQRHRTTIAAQLTYAPTKRWSFSLKESFQHSHYGPVNKTTERFRLQDEDDPNSLQQIASKVKHVAAKDRMVMRSKLTAKYDIRHCPLQPFASVDYGFGLNYTTSKWKLTAGTDIKVNKNNKFTLAYRFQTENDDDEPNGHMLCVGYGIKF